MLDRELQRRILERMRNAYPGPANGVELIALVPESRGDRAQRGRVIALNLAYLDEHGLVKAPIHLSSDGKNHASFGRSTITARGLDFLADDGGLSAILGVVTVRLHADTVRELLVARVEAEESLSAADKSGLLSEIRRLPETTLQEAAKYLVTAGLTHLPDAIHWVRALIGG